jgi:hypothetical protein
MSLESTANFTLLVLRCCRSVLADMGMGSLGSLGSHSRLAGSSQIKLHQVVEGRGGELSTETFIQWKFAAILLNGRITAGGLTR